jgi:hypothetical protein
LIDRTRNDERQERIEKSKEAVKNADYPEPKEALESYRRSGRRKRAGTVLVEDVVVPTSEGRQRVPAGSVAVGGVIPVRECWGTSTTHGDVVLIGTGADQAAVFHPSVTTASEGAAVIGVMTLLVGEDASGERREVVA